MLSQRIIAGRAMVTRYEKSRTLTEPKAQIDDRRMMLMSVMDRLGASFDMRIINKRGSLAVSAGKLSALDPMAVLARGYGAVYDSDGGIVKGISDVRIGEKVSLKLSDGTIGAEIREIAPDNNN